MYWGNNRDQHTQNSASMELTFYIHPVELRMNDEHERGSVVCNDYVLTHRYSTIIRKWRKGKRIHEVEKFCQLPMGLNCEFISDAEGTGDKISR